MKFLITGHQNVPIPPEMGAALYQAATAWVDGMIADGVVDCHYVFAGTGGFAITNADSHEAVFDALASYPLFGFFKWEVQALADWKHSYETLIKLFQSVGG